MQSWFYFLKGKGKAKAAGKRESALLKMKHNVPRWRGWREAPGVERSAQPAVATTILCNKPREYSHHI
jgi:hypothetical protein